MSRYAALLLGSSKENMKADIKLKKQGVNKMEKIDGRTRHWVYTGNKEGRSNKTVILDVIYLGQCGCGFNREVTRTIELRETQTLDDLHEAIIFNSFGWDDPHMYSFNFDNKPYSKNREMEYSCCPEPDMLGGRKLNSTKTKLSGLKLKKNQKFLFVFDFGDDHQFGIIVKDFGETRGVVEYPLIIESKGKAPAQYPK